MNKKGIKTTVVAIVSGLLGLSVFIMWYVGKIETLELAVGLSGVAFFTNMVIGYFAKDADQSHTTDGIDTPHVGPRPKNPPRS